MSAFAAITELKESDSSQLLQSNQVLGTRYRQKELHVGVRTSLQRATVAVFYTIDVAIMTYWVSCGSASKFRCPAHMNNRG